MLDWLDALFTPCPLHLREMGYKRELFGIRSRWRESGWAWQAHCDRTRKLLLSACNRCATKRTAVLFGSGFLHDIPLDEFSRDFEKVVLVDLLHPYSVRCKAKRYPNVALVEADVSETAEGVWLSVEQGGTALPPSKPRLFLEDAEVDFAASVNLLSQLPCMPEEYLKKWRKHRPEQIAAYCRDVVEAHLAYLRSLPGVVALVADTEIHTLNESGRVLSRRTTLYGASLPFRGEEWVWPLVPGRQPKHLVVTGVEDVKETTFGGPMR